MTQRPADDSASFDDSRDALAQLIRAAGRRPAPREVDYERVLGASRAAWHAKVRARRRRWWYALAAGVALAAVGAAALLTLTPTTNVARVAMAQGQVETFVERTREWTSLAPGVTLGEGARVRTVGDAGAAFDLEDGISLRASSATEWVFAGPRRIELDGGTLYVDSGRGPLDRGIEIATAFGIVRDVGTQFEVRALSMGLRVRVREGVAELRRPETGAVATAAGEQLSVDRGGSVQRQTIAADDTEWLWAQALATPPSLDGRPAIEVLTWIARESGKRLVFADAESELRARSATLHGESEGLLPLEVLEVLVATTDGLEYSLGAETLTIRER